LQFHTALHELIGNAAGVRHGAGETIELGHHQRVAGADGCKRLVEAGPQPIGAGQTVVPLRTMTARLLSKL
jgi:hypothetical protein